MTQNTLDQMLNTYHAKCKKRSRTKTARAIYDYLITKSIPIDRLPY